MPQTTTSSIRKHHQICVCILLNLLQIATPFTTSQTRLMTQRNPFLHVVKQAPTFCQNSRLHVTQTPSTTSSRTGGGAYPHDPAEELNLELASYLHKVENTGDISHIYEAESILHGNSSLADAISYNTVVSSWAKAAHAFATGRAKVPMDGTHLHGVYNARDAAMRAQSVLDEMIDQWEEDRDEDDDTGTVVAPDNIGFNAAIDAWSKSRVKDAGVKADELLRKMISLSRKEDGPQPDVVSFNSVIDAWVHDADGESIRRVESLLSVMETLDIKANTRTYNSIINVYTKSRDKQQVHVDRILEFLAFLEQQFEETGDEDLKPDVTTFTSAIDCMAHSSDRNKGQKAIDILERMERLYNRTEDTSIRPSIRTYTAVINALAWGQDKDAPLKAEKFLEELESRREQGEIKPNVWTYSAVINAWARSREITKPQRALKLLKNMKALYEATGDETVHPNAFIYNGVIDSCARCPAMDNPKQQGQALKIAFAVFKALKLDKKAKVNNITYGLLFKTAKNLMPEGKERDDVIKAVFENCKKDGLVDNGVLRQVRQAAGGDLFSELVGDYGANEKGYTDYRTVPSDWRRNVN